MKKSELKALIREVIEGLHENDKVSQMIDALKNNPEFVDAAMKKFGGNLRENRSSVMKNLAMLALAAGLSASAVSTANAGVTGDYLRMMDAQRQRGHDINSQFGYDTKNPDKGSTLEIIRKAKVDSIFKELREEYINARESSDSKKVNEVMLKTVKLAVDRLKAANDFDKERKFILGNLAGITKFHIDDVTEILKKHPEWLEFN